MKDEAKVNIISTADENSLFIAGMSLFCGIRLHQEKKIHVLTEFFHKLIYY